MNLTSDGSQDNWLRLLKRTEKGAVIPCEKNAYIALEHDISLRNRYAFNDMLNVPCVVDSAPRPLTDADVFHCLTYLQDLMPRLSMSVMARAIEAYSRDRPFHPLRHELDGYERDWDGCRRSNVSAVTHLDAAHTEYNCRIWQMWLLQAVNRIYRPGCKADYMVVLEGPQGIFKSTVCQILGGEYFSDCLPEITIGKDVSIHLLGKWIIEVPEMHAMGSKTEASLLKSFMSRTHERFRAPYGRQEIIAPRQCVFIGTTNKETYLRDETGNRRFWPLRCGKINVDGLERDREQLLGELVHLVKGGEPAYPDAEFESRHISDEQDARYEEDAWTGVVYEYLEPRSETTILDIYKNALFASETSRLGTLETRRISAILRKLGWREKHTKRGNVWVRG